MANNSYRDLTVWQKSMQLVTKIYRSSDCFLRSEAFGLTSQLRGSVVSVPSNIAEGQGRDSGKEFLRHLSFAYGSLMVAETRLQIAANLGYIERAELDTLLADTAEVGRMLNGLLRSIRNSVNRQPTTDN